MKRQTSSPRRNVERALENTRETHPPRSFRERLQSLAGSTAYRMPVEGTSTRQRDVPAAHELAAALGMARRRIPQGGAMVPDPTDVGPDIAIDIVMTRTAHAGPVLRAVADAMAADRARACRRNRPWLRIVCWAAYYELVHGARQPQMRPAEMTEQDWDLLTDAASRIMEALAEDAVGRAARAWRRAA